MAIEDEGRLLEELRSNVKVMEDRNGIRIEVLKLRDGVISPNLVRGFGDKIKIKMQDVRQLAMRDDDILVCSYPKSGMFLF